MVQTKTTVRKAAANDARLLAELGQRMFLQAFGGEITERDLTPYVAERFGELQQKAELSDPRVCFFIAEVDQEPAGYAKLITSLPPVDLMPANSIELERLYVDQKWLGRGVGDVLIKICLEEALERKIEVMWLDVWERNLRAQAFYRKYGFREVGARAYRVGKDEQRHLLMAKVFVAE